MTEIVYKKNDRENCLQACNQLETKLKINKNSKSFEKNFKDTNLAVKQAMAEELEKIGLSEDAISRQLNINYKRS